MSAPNSAQAPVAPIAAPPVIQQVSALMKSNRLRAILPSSMMWPARMKNGIAITTKLLMLENCVSARRVKEVAPNHSLPMTARPPIA